MNLYYPGSDDLFVLQEKLNKLQKCAHAPPLERAVDSFEQIERAILGGLFVAQWQLSMAQSSGPGFEEHQQFWQAKITDINKSLAESTDALSAVVDELRMQRFRRFAAAMVIGGVALKRLFIPFSDGRPPRVLRGYIEESALIEKKSVIN